MTQVDWKRVRPLLAKLYELPREEHTAFLAEACEGDTSLARTVVRIYEAESTDASFLKSPLAEASASASRPALGAGALVGPYRLIEELGRGGMGAVWLAKRDDEFERHVALKLVKRGMDTDEVVRRFRRERQLLADLEHPGIVRLLDGGATDDGRPYLALEVVRGSTIDEHCRDLPLEDRVRIFLQVADAVAAAHELGVVHRDLKPSNVLVTGGGEAKVLDFGIAKVLSDEGPEVSLLTRTGERLLTPRYAAPEQVRGEACSPATDVYALGVMLYELLCERPPYEVETATLRDIESAVCDEIPKRPSLHADRTTRRRVAGDLDVIAMRALAKEPARRYRDAGKLAEDVRRHLAHEPIEARADSTLYRAVRFVRRNRLLVGSMTAILVALAVGLVATFVQYRESERRREDAEWKAYVGTVKRAETAIALQSSFADFESHSPELFGWEWQHIQARGDLSLRVVHELKGSTELDIDASGRTLVAKHRAELVFIDIDSGEELRRFDTGYPVYDVHYSPDSTLVAAAHKGGVGVYEAESGDTTAFWPWGGMIKCARFLPDGRRVVSANSSENIKLHSLDDPETVRVLGTVKGIVRDMEVSPSGDRVAVAAVECAELFGIDDPSLDLKLKLDERDLSLSEVAFSSSGRYLAGIGMDGTARVWDLTTELPITPPRHYGSSCNAMVFLPDRDALVVGTTTLRIWDLATGREHSLPGTKRSIKHMVTDPDEPRIYTSVQDGRIHEWSSMSTQVPRHHLTDDVVLSVSVHPDGDSYAALLGKDVVRVDLGSGEILVRRKLDSSALRLAYAPEETMLVVASAEGLGILHGDTLETLHQVPLVGARKLAFDPTERTLAVGKSDGSVTTFRVSDWNVLQELETGLSAVGDLAFHPAGNQLVVGGKDGGLVKVETGSRRVLPFQDAPETAIYSVDWSADGEQIAAGGVKTLGAWSAASLSPLYQRTSAQVHVVYPKDSERLITSFHGNVQIRDTRRWDIMCSLKENRLQLTEMALAPDGRTLLACDVNGDVLIYNAVPLPDTAGD